MRRTWWIWLIGAVAGLITITIALGVFVDEPLRRYVERQLNTHLKGYTVRVGKLDLHPLRFSVELFDVAIVQDANPDPAIVHVPRLSSSVQWRALLSARVVSDVLVERPRYTSTSSKSGRKRRTMCLFRSGAGKKLCKPSLP